MATAQKLNIMVESLVLLHYIRRPQVEISSEVLKDLLSPSR
jgi:hypothetical protein